ncbi:ABC-2 type transport system ATP-binding protein [Amycolatopsis arida]|uniref:ABC-2 type transport system ATP-binding protein n=1 Tax=Amycolatopsis arida TaxID=587909 RepID=A0A1I5WCS2_9PSEU|nr:ABC transporter ATP-binding protein [Amycolatopsis arida]TDX92222.1 ABC-2 type transport system ATP-binding protein [Amycolatopsis arida]SFQ17564.1 ABC-2 type transport system ATP-binding protein [Amycolatopsis arida]
MTKVIELDRLSKKYGRRRGLVGLTLDIERGEVFGFLGPNGAGKSTTLRLLLDLIRPTGGRAMVLGRDPRTAGPAPRRRVGYLPGDFVVDGRQRVDECLTFLANLRGGVARARIVELAERLDLELDARIGSLSKGNRQKVGLVQAFAHQPELLILDEPTSGLDPLVQQEFLAMVREARAAGQTVFMSSHIMSEVERVADRVGIIREGGWSRWTRWPACVSGRCGKCGSPSPRRWWPSRSSRCPEWTTWRWRGGRCVAAWWAVRTRCSRRSPGTPWSTCSARNPTWKSSS